MDADSITFDVTYEVSSQGKEAFARSLSSIFDSSSHNVIVVVIVLHYHF